MPVLDAVHDLGHPVADDPNWSESCYFNAWAPEAGTGFFSRIAVRPHEPHADGFMTLWLPDGDTATLRESRAADLPEPGAPALAHLRFERLAPMETWRVRGEGAAEDGRSVAIYAAFRALTPAIGVDGAARAPASAAGSSVMRSLGSGHYEQAGTWQGTITVDGASWALDGLGNRDRSWGPRRTDGGAGMRYWRWFSMNFQGGVHLGGIRVGTPNGDLQRGWLWRDGAHASLRGIEVRTAYGDDGTVQRRIELTARERAGRTHAFTGEVLRAVPLAARGHEDMVIVEALTRWTYEGLTGYGIAEYAHERDADGRAVVADDSDPGLARP